MDLNNLMQNKLLLQYLSSAGGAISAGEPIGPALNDVTQQNIKAQNFNKLLARLMKGEVPEGKVVRDNKGMKIDIPHSALGDLGDLSGGTGGMRDVARQQLTGITSLEPIQKERVNPFRIAL